MYTVVLVDDNPWAIADMVQSFHFDLWGFQIAGQYRSAEEALPEILRSPPDLILTDIRMENMNGLDLSKILREKGIQSLIVLISGYEQFAYAQCALRYDVFDYLLKPLRDDTTQELMQRVASRLNEHRPAPSESSQSGILDAAIQYIEQHFRDDLSLNDVADSIYINKNYLSELFSKKMGITFTQYKNKVKIKHACDMLDQGQSSMTEIALLTGFDSSSRFSRVFKQLMGMTPSEYCERGSKSGSD